MMGGHLFFPLTPTPWSVLHTAIVPLRHAATAYWVGVVIIGFVALIFNVLKQTKNGKWTLGLLAFVLLLAVLQMGGAWPLHLGCGNEMLPPR